MTTKTVTHTPGKWAPLHDFDGDYGIFGGLAGEVHIATTNADSPEDKANARLIAAAPQLLEALEASLIEHVACHEVLMLNPNMRGTKEPAIIEQIRAAIRSAKGETL